MSKLIFTLDRDWIDEKKKEYGNPVRKLERVIRSYEGAKLEKSDYDSLTVEITEEGRRALALELAAFIGKSFGEEKPWSIMHVSGDAKDLELPSEDSAVDTESAPEAEKPEEKKTEETSGQEQEKSGERTFEEMLEESSAQEESPEEPVQETVKKAEEPEKAEEAEQAATVDEKAKRAIEEICDSVPVKYSPELANYIRELGQVIPMLGLMRAKECLWSQNLLVSIDKGCGFSSFMNAISKLYYAYGLVDKEDGAYTVKEIVIENTSGQDNKYADWKSALSRAQEFATQNERKSQKIILAMDISQWQTELTSTAVLEYLRKINEAAKNFTCVFRIPYMEQQVVKRIEEALGDVMSVKTLQVAPMSIESMVDYMKSKLDELGCTTDEACDDGLERWIIKEKSDDSFFGYKSLDKMMKQLVYHKALANSAIGMVKRHIEPADVNGMLEEEDILVNPRELLSKLIGMAEVKRRIEEIVIQIKTQKEMASQGVSLERPCIHMMFTGNPGTGKTTVARILAQLMKEEGVLRKGYFYEITGRSLCGRYVGETAPKTSTYCRDAYGSVLFIDEAYSLNQGEGRDYGKEAVQTLIAEMENHRDDFCVIMAGYKDEMEQLLTLNPGLESRIPYVIDFPNYEREELEQIFFAMVDGNLAYEEGLKETVHNFFQSIPDEIMGDKTFSNARLVRNLFERAWGKAAYRRNLTGQQDFVILREDLISASEEDEFKKLLEKERGRKHIGFVTP